jgi:hypothetical protein
MPVAFCGHLLAGRHFCRLDQSERAKCLTPNGFSGCMQELKDQMTSVSVANSTTSPSVARHPMLADGGIDSQEN